MAEKNTYLQFTMDDDSVIDVTLSFYRLYQLKTSNKEMYEDYFQIVKGGINDEFDALKMIYIGYLCAHINDEADDLEYPDFESFLKNVSDSRPAMWNCYFELTGQNSKKKTNTGKRSTP